MRIGDFTLGAIDVYTLHVSSLSTNSPTAMATSTQPATQQAPPVLAGPCWILDLPAELVLGILELLDSSHVVLFSLTCKAAFNIFRHAPFKHRHLSAIDREMMITPRRGFLRSRQIDSPRNEFLQLLTHDHPGLFICRRCWKLHKNPTGECRLAQHTTALIQDIPQLRPKGLMTFGPLWPNYAFTFDEARAVIERACNGPGPGLPLSHLSISTNWKLARLGTACSNPEFLHGYLKLDTEAVIVDRSLFFHRIYRILLLPEKVMPFFTTIATSAAFREREMREIFTFCHHNTDVSDAFSPSPDTGFWEPFLKTDVSSAISSVITTAQNKIGLPEPAGLDGWDLDAFKLRINSFSGCSKCTTDYAITIHNHGRAGVEIVCDAIQDLGDCTNPDDRKWEQCWHSRLPETYHGPVSRRQRNPMVGPETFPTRPGTSAKKHQSAPTVGDLWNTHEHERAALNEHLKSTGSGHLLKRRPRASIS
ncbi:hypothetical protein F5Y05DRAFT_17192 [Hypoxylon sp. FL0543]|nr:hypothetical protein F5Y05DRAFT_17192 [Hypoxylon sp. FL0543]